MRVSIALHREDPKFGNQRDFECAYMHYNRQYADLNDEGGCVIEASFPASGEMVPNWIITHFSIGICEGVGPDMGGQIINSAPMHEPVPVEIGVEPKVNGVMQIDPARLAELGLTTKG